MPICWLPLEGRPKRLRSRGMASRPVVDQRQGVCVLFAQNEPLVSSEVHLLAKNSKARVSRFPPIASPKAHHIHCHGSTYTNNVNKDLAAERIHG
jgi:hypothetical protein